MANETNAGFEIPAEMRAIAEKSVEQAKQACETFLSAAQHAVSTAETQAASARSGAKDVSELALRYAEQNVASSFEFAEKLARAKDGQEVMKLHADYAQAQIAALSDQVKELSKQTAKMAGGKH